jgi:uncharacterized SAM-binding protein YcdF (DUF218 family)
MLTLVLVGIVLLWDGPADCPWLHVDEVLRPASAIAVMNGDNTRAETAAALFRAGYGREIWLTNDPRSGSAGTADAGTAENLRRLERAGVPREAIRQMPSPAGSTKAELQQIGWQLRRRGMDAAIVVTSTLHGRRVRLLWDCAVGDPPHVIIHAPAYGNYVGSGVVRRELLGSVAAWFCIPGGGGTP